MARHNSLEINIDRKISSIGFQAPLIKVDRRSETFSTITKIGKIDRISCEKMYMQI